MNLAPADLRSALRRFADFTDAELDMLTPHISERALPKGAVLAREGAVSREVGFVRAGALRHYYTKDGMERTTYFYFEGHRVGAYISCITGQPSQLTIEALTDCQLLTFPYRALADLFSRSHRWEEFGRRLAEYLAIGLEERMVTLLMLSPEERYHHLLRSNREKILARIPQHFIANGRRARALQR